MQDDTAERHGGDDDYQLQHGADLHRHEFGPGSWNEVFVYEYPKDVGTSFFSIGVIHAYRFVLLRLQGEASLLSAPDEGSPVEPIERPDRFLVRKLGKEFIVAADDIVWLQAEGNDVNLHVEGRLHPLRSTLTALEPLDNGDARLTLRDGTLVPCSRRYRPALRARGSVEVVDAISPT